MSSVLYDAPGPRTRRTSRTISWITALIVLVLVGYVLFSLGGQGLFDADRWDIFQDPLVWLDLLRALGVTLSAAGVAAVGAILFGIVLSLLRLAPTRWVRIPVTVVLELLRGLPVLLMMFFFWGFVGLDPFQATVIGLILYNGAIIGEALRSGLLALPRGQREAGLAIGLSGFRARMLIEFPQAFRNMLPIIVAQLVVLLKDTSLGYIVSLAEFVQRGQAVANFFGAQQYAFSVFVVMVGMYLVVNLSVSATARLLARRRGQTVSTANLRDAGMGGGAGDPTLGTTIGAGADARGDEGGGNT